MLNPLRPGALIFNPFFQFHGASVQLQQQRRRWLIRGLAGLSHPLLFLEDGGTHCALSAAQGPACCSKPHLMLPLTPSLTPGKMSCCKHEASVVSWFTCSSPVLSLKAWLLCPVWHLPSALRLHTFPSTACLLPPLARPLVQWSSVIPRLYLLL